MDTVTYVKRGLAIGATVIALGGCSSGPDAPGGVTQGVTMEQSERLPATAVWRKPGLDAAQYTSFQVAPVQIYRGNDANYGDASEADKQAVASFMRQEFTRVLAQNQPNAATARTGSPARLQLTLAGMSGNVPVASTAASILPLGLVRNMAVGGQSPVFSGSVTYKGEIYDGRTGELVAAFVTSKTPSALDLGATMSSQAAQQAAVTESAYDLRDAIRAAQQTAARPGG